MALHPPLSLQDFDFKDLFDPAGLHLLDQRFLAALPSPLCETLKHYRGHPDTLADKDRSELLLALARELEPFLSRLFGIEDAVAVASAQTLSHQPVMAFKQYFVQRRAKKLLADASQFPSFATLERWLEDALAHASLKSDDRELAIALLASQYLHQPEQYVEETVKLVQWCVQALASPEGQKAVAGWSSFRLPERIDHDHLVKCKVAQEDPLQRLEATHFRPRDGFALTDPRMSARAVQNEVNYCIYCHDHDGDFCSKGFPVKKGDAAEGFRKNAEGITLTGCPLDEKISEMHLLKRDGLTLAALAMIMADNPMCPATGHRICNDCMKACIYQKQDPVNIPEIETRCLTDVLALPWGVEIYDLLTRWNPLRHRQWVMKPWNGLKILIAGMGPAGFTLAHHMLQEGFAVVGFDGLKIEPLPARWLKEPIHQFSELTEPLDLRKVSGFGGVAEYGITVRWDKNFLRLIQLSLMRRPTFQVFGGVRFGGTITVEKAFAMGFDHLALAVGAGLPKALSIKGSLAPGMRQANDFLMALQLGSADREDSLTGLQVRLPAVVIGGGLTSVDTATEVQAYYIRQVENTLARYEKLDTAKLRASLDAASLVILDEFLQHGAMVREERKRSQPDFNRLIRQWGGVTIAYRRTMKESPAWIHNHEELQKALEEGIYYLESLEPAEMTLDAHGHASALVCHRAGDSQATVTLPARSVFVATGTKPNIAYEFEHRGTFLRNGPQYQHYEFREDKLQTAHGSLHCKDPAFGPFTSWMRNHHQVSLIGDSHPVFHGSVVKAIASAMRTWPKIVERLEAYFPASPSMTEYQQFVEKMQDLFSATVLSITRPVAGILELTIRAPLAVEQARPGHFFRLQGFETTAPVFQGARLQMEPLALTASGIDRKNSALRFIIFERGASSLLCGMLKRGDAVSLMGPTGVRAKIAASEETVLIAGGPQSLALLQSYAPALREAGNRVIFLGDFPSRKMLYSQDVIENLTDLVIWVTREGEPIPARRPGDVSDKGDALEALIAFGNRAEGSLLLTDVDRIFLIGDTSFLKQFQKERDLRLKPLLCNKNPRIQASVYSTMQCMLKGVCAQCLQWQVDPETGQRTKAVFACSWPEQPLELIDFDNLEERQSQNRLSEKINAQWVETLMTSEETSHV